MGKIYVMASQLSNYLQSFTVLSADMTAAIADSFARTELRRNQFFLKEGQVCKAVGFVESRLLVYYRLAEDGQAISVFLSII